MVIRRLLFGMGLGALGLGGVLLACNAVLGIGSASPEPDAGSDAAVVPESVNFERDPCGTYCAVMKKNCAGPYLEYLGPDQGDASDVCMKLCQVLSPGDYRPFPGANPAVEQQPPSEDTLGCRLWHAHKAQEAPADPATHCRHAGPLGSEGCCTIPDGAVGCAQRPCGPFCNLDVASTTCGGDRVGAVYRNMPANCEGFCSSDAGFPYIAGNQDGAANGGLAFDLVDENGLAWESSDTLNCRLWHLEKALATGDLSFHCPHTDQDGGGACTGPHP